MTLPADRPSMSAIAQRLVATWNGAAMSWNPVALIVAAWAVLSGPLVIFRGYNSDEGLAVSLARTALEQGEWLTPYMFNIRWIERPTLLSWLIAAVSAPFGTVNQLTARVPIALFLLLGCLLIYALLRKIGAGIAAALVGVALFLACPLVMRSYVMITADMPLAVLLFLAFVLWWDGYQKGAVGFGRWIAVGAVLALAGLLKGPQPLAYFVLGIGVFILATRAWRQIPGLILAGVMCALPLAAWYTAVYAPGDEQAWAAFMRVRPAVPFSGPLVAGFATLTETLPAALLAAAFLIAVALRGRSFVPRRFVPALSCYAFTAAIIVLLWPGGSAPRYYFPIVLPLCVFGGLGYELLSVRRPQIVAPILLLTAALLVYALVYSAASPLLPMRYRRAQIEAARITALVRTAPGPIYRTGDTALNVLPYVPGRILSVSLGDMATAAGPAWMVLTSVQADALLMRRPDKLHIVMPLGDRGEWRLLRLDK